MELQELIRRALELGRPAGFITFDQLHDLISPTKMEAEDIEALMGALSDEGINLVDAP